MAPRSIAVVLFLSAVSAWAADEPTKSPPELSGLTYRNIGPAAGGRVSRVCGVAGDPLTYYVATASGGVWKSTDGGVSFQPIFDEQSTSSIGSIAVAPSDPNVVYVGTGESNIRGNVCYGNGIYRSVDGGKNWTHCWKQIGQIGQMAVHPTNPDIAFAAVLGHAFGPNAERGIYRTDDGGKSWKRVLYKDVDTGASDVAIDPNNPRVIFAGLWQTRRKPWDLISGGPGSGLYVSRDGGDTWDRIGPEGSGKKKKGKPGAEEESALPKGPWGKVCVAIARSDSSRVYAMIEAEEGGLFRSDDGGGSWELVSGERYLRQRAWYFSTITVHPTNPDVVYCPQVQMQKSIDGGKTFKSVKGFQHVDHHDLWIDPKDPRRMIDANDGGTEISTDGGKAWRSPPLPISQFYHIACDNSAPYRVLGCMQDMGSCSGPSRSFFREGILLGDWHGIGGGEAGFAVPDPTDPNIVYAGEYGGYISRYDHRTRQSRHVGIYPFDPSGFGAEALKYRFQWTSPIVISRHDPKTVYHASNVLFRTTNGGQSWDKVTSDLTRNDKNKQKWAGGPITGDNTGVEIYGTIFALAESPLNKKLLWVGTDDGLVQISRDYGYTWHNVTANIPDLPDWGTVTCVEPSPHDEGTAYVVVDAHRLDNYKPLVWRTKDFGETWQKINDDLPEDEVARVVRCDPKKKGLIYLGTEHGVFFSRDDGDAWEPLKLNLPPVPVTDIVVKDDDLVVGTQGRSIWILDDLTAVREMTEAVAKKAAHVFAPRPAARWALHGTVTHHETNYVGENAPYGAVISYYLKEKSTKPPRIEILNDKNVVIRKIEGRPKKKKPAPDQDEDDDDDDRPEIPAQEGLNRFAWDLCHQGSEVIKKAKLDAGDPKSGPMVAPGTYTIKLFIDQRTLTTQVVVTMDPRVTEPRGVLAMRKPPEKLNVAPRVATPEDVSRLENAGWILRQGGLDIVKEEAKDQEAFSLRLRDDITRLTKAVDELRSIRKQVKLHEELFAKDAKARPYLKSASALAGKLDELEAKFHNPKAKVSYDILAQKGGAKLYSQLSSLLGFASNGDGPPTEGMRTLADELEKELEDILAEYEGVKTGDLAKVNELARKMNGPIIWVPTPKK